MADSTHPHRAARQLGRLTRLLALTGAVLAVCAALAGSALADGDPASDVLASQASYLPADSGISAGEQSQITAMLRSADRAGLHLRVAVIASRTDLGSIGELWRRPQLYARFLGQELTVVYGGRLLVVMRNGYGLYPTTGAGAPAARAGLSGLAAPGGHLGAATLSAIQKLGAAAGVRLTIPRATAGPHASSTDVTAIVVFALGVVVILAAWGLSLRVRPLGRAEPGRPAQG